MKHTGTTIAVAVPWASACKKKVQSAAHPGLSRELSLSSFLYRTIEKLTYRYAQDRWHSRAPGYTCNNKAGAALGVPSDATDAQGDDGGEADAFKEEG